MKRVLVTGSTGFIGRHCLPFLVERGYDVHSVTTHHGRMGPKGVTWHRANLLSPAELSAVVSAVQADSLLHLAWVTTPGEYTGSTSNLPWLSASLQLFKEFVEQGGQRIVCSGTCFEYDLSHGVCREDSTPLVPDTLYGTCKNALQSVLHRYCEGLNVNSAWGRVFFLYGPHERPERLVSSVVLALLQNQEAPCTLGTQVRDFLHVKDVARAFVELLASNVTGPVNVASGEPVEIRELVLEIARQLGKLDLVKLGARPTPEGEPPRIVADVTRLRDQVGFTPRFNHAQGLKDTIAWWSAKGVPEFHRGVAGR